jgi:23S rRNA maturation mini-RNase III
MLCCYGFVIKVSVKKIFGLPFNLSFNIHSFYFEISNTKRQAKDRTFTFWFETKPYNTGEEIWSSKGLWQRIWLNVSKKEVKAAKYKKTTSTGVLIGYLNLIKKFKSFYSLLLLCHLVFTCWHKSVRMWMGL